MREIFMSVAAAEGNVGDIVIRRQALRALAGSSNASATIYTGAMGQSYLEAFNFDSAWRVTSSPFVFLTRLCAGVLARRVVLVMAPGPAVLGASLSSSVKHLGVALMFAIARCVGCRVLVLGRAVRGGTFLSRFSEQLILRAAHLYVSRDRKTAELLGAKVFVAPDLAFSESPPIDGGKRRSRVAISLRHDREICIPVLKDLIGHLRGAGLDPFFLTQVKEDGDRHAQLAAELYTEHFLWPNDRSHSDHERALTSMYGECVAAISDRLHVLILAARQGAIPVIVESANEQKLHASLDELLAPAGVDLAMEEDVYVGFDEEESARVRKAVIEASQRLESLYKEVEAIVR